MSNNNPQDKSLNHKQQYYPSNQKQGHTLTSEDRSKGGQHSHSNRNQVNQDKN